MGSGHARGDLVGRDAGGFGRRTIAEGVEDAGTLDLLRELGVDCAQGFAIARPAPVADVLGPV